MRMVHNKDGSYILLLGKKDRFANTARMGDWLIDATNLLYYDEYKTTVINPEGKEVGFKIVWMQERNNT